MSDNVKERAIHGMSWKLAEKLGMQVAQFVIQLVLARMLLPEEYGVVGLLAIFITISDIFVQQSFTAALIQKKDADERDFTVVFWINVIGSILIYAVLFLMSPYVAAFYQNEKLTVMMRILSFNVILGSFGAVPNAILSRNLDFQKSFFRSLCNVIVQGIVGIYCAKEGYGAWSLVYSKLAGTLMGSLVLCITVRWKFTAGASVERVKSLFSFGSKVLANNLINTIFNNINSLVIGKFYTEADLGFYQRGQQVPQAIMNAVDGSFNEVLFPTLSGVQSDGERLKQVLRRSMRTSMYLVFPMMFGLIAVAEPLISLILTDKWLPCVPYLRLQCILCMFWPLSARTHALNAIGRSDVTLKISFITRTITLLAIILSVKYGIVAIMTCLIGVSLLSVLISTYYVNKWIGYSMWELFQDVLPSLLIAILMATLVYEIENLMTNPVLTIFLQISCGALIYVLCSALSKNESFFYLMSILKTYIDKMKRKKNHE